MNNREAYINALDHYESVMDVMNNGALIDVMIDEVSMVYDDPDHLMDFVTWAVEVEGMEHFNKRVMDRMHRLDVPGDEWFDVRFEFLRPKDQHFRIEAMCIGEGSAPLHEAALAIDGPGTCVHASYKPRGYGTHVVRLNRVLSLEAEYSNAYGLFSYWSGLSTYVKPRLSFADRSKERAKLVV